jgi:N-acylglucosamine 2-epimerase/mannose-6-phosphate isomerase
MGVDYLLDRAWQGPDKGFARQLTREGAVLDPVADLYDHAFVLFALAWRFKATGDAKAHDWLHRTLDFVETKLRHPREGFWHWTPPSGSRQQNPHMHLTEAMLIAHEATGEARFADLARELVDLFQNRFFDLKSGTLAEYFTADLGRAPGVEGRIVEPGHQMEWAWILNRARLQLGVDAAATIRALIGFAEKHGVDPNSRATYNQIRDDGAPLDRASRTWPNTERLKAAIALYELDGVNPGPVFDTSSRLLLDRYLATKIPGLWIDTFDADGRPTARTVPTSTLYHVFLAFAEVLRTGKALGFG